MFLLKAKAVPIGTVHGDWQKIANGKWKYIGHGHQGHVFHAKVEPIGDVAVKVSKQAPFQARHAPKKTPKGARDDLMLEHNALKDLAGSSLIPKHYATWRKGKKLFLAREHLKPIEMSDLKRGEPEAVRDELWRIFRKEGYYPWDKLQFARDGDGNLKLLDMGGFRKYNDKSLNGKKHAQEDFEIEIGTLFDVRGVGRKYAHLDEQAIKERITKIEGMQSEFAIKSHEAMLASLKAELEHRGSLKKGEASVRFLFKAKKVPVGTRHTWADGVYVKVDDHNWHRETVKKLAVKALKDHGHAKREDFKEIQKEVVRAASDWADYLHANDQHPEHTKPNEHHEHWAEVFDDPEWHKSGWQKTADTVHTIVKNYYGFLKHEGHKRAKGLKRGGMAERERTYEIHSGVGLGGEDRPGIFDLVSIGRDRKNTVGSFGSEAEAKEAKKWWLKHNQLEVNAHLMPKKKWVDEMLAVIRHIEKDQWYVRAAFGLDDQPRSAGDHFERDQAESGASLQEHERRRKAMLRLKKEYALRHQALAYSAHQAGYELGEGTKKDYPLLSGEIPPEVNDAVQARTNMIRSVDLAKTNKDQRFRILQMIKQTNIIMDHMGVRFIRPLHFRVNARLGKRASRAAATYWHGKLSVEIHDFTSDSKSMIHELGHAIDYAMHEGTDSTPRSAAIASDPELKAKYKEMLELVRSTPYYQWSHKGKMMGQSFSAYLNKPTEVFARAFEVYGLVKAEELIAAGKIDKSYIDNFVPHALYYTKDDPKHADAPDWKYKERIAELMEYILKHDKIRKAVVARIGIKLVDPPAIEPRGGLVRFFFKARKAPVGTRRKWADGTYVKVDDHKWQKEHLPRLAEKTLEAGGYKKRKDYAAIKKEFTAGVKHWANHLHKKDIHPHSTSPDDHHEYFSEMFGDDDWKNSGWEKTAGKIHETVMRYHDLLHEQGKKRVEATAKPEPKKKAEPKKAKSKKEEISDELMEKIWHAHLELEPERTSRDGEASPREEQQNIAMAKRHLAKLMKQAGREVTFEEAVAWDDKRLDKKKQPDDLVTQALKAKAKRRQQEAGTVKQPAEKPPAPKKEPPKQEAPTMQPAVVLPPPSQEPEPKVPVDPEPKDAPGHEPKKPFKPSPYQQAIFDWIEKGSGNAMIDAKAGSGKTATIVRALDVIPRDKSIIFLAFNTSARDELLGRVPQWAVDQKAVRTLNALGFASWARFMGGYNRVKVEKGTKTSAILRDMLQGPEDKTYFGTVKSMVSKAKQMGLAPASLAAHGIKGLVPDTREQWENLIEHFSIEIDYPQTVEHAIRLSRLALEKSIMQKDVIDFDDQFYMPIIYNTPWAKYDFLFVDEAQDVSDIQREAIRRSTDTKTRVVAVGDPHQAIYGFRGANPESLDLIRKQFNAKVFELPISYRCGKKIIELAQTIVPGIKPRPDAQPGEIKDLGTKFKIEDFKQTDMIVCRNNAPLVSMAYKLLRERVPCKVMGRDIGLGMTSLIKKLKPKSLDDLGGKLVEWSKREINKLKLKDPDADTTAIEDKFETLSVFMAESQAKDVDGLVREIESMFKDDEGKKRDSILRLSSVHKAKGLEAPRVFILNHHLMPSSMAKKPWEIVQEKNLMYVAYTRAMDELVFIETAVGGKKLKKALGLDEED